MAIEYSNIQTGLSADLSWKLYSKIIDSFDEGLTYSVSIHRQLFRWILDGN